MKRTRERLKRNVMVDNAEMEGVCNRTLSKKREEDNETNEEWVIIRTFSDMILLYV